MEAVDNEGQNLSAQMFLPSCDTAHNYLIKSTSVNLH